MKDIKNAFDYHNELSRLKALIDSIENTLDYIDAAFSHVEDPSSVLSMSLSLAQADLKKSLAYAQEQHDNIKAKLSSSYF